MTKALPSRDLIHLLLRYEVDTGDLIWFPRPREMFKSSSQFLNWNGRYPGTIAGYVRPTMNRGPGYLHIGINGTICGEPVPPIIDHKDHDRLNNRIGNLRAATMTQNKANTVVRRDSVSGLKGIKLSRSGKRYGARITHRGLSVYLGSFQTIEDAKHAYQEAADRLFGEFARWDQR